MECTILLSLTLLLVHMFVCFVVFGLILCRNKSKWWFAITTYMTSKKNICHSSFNRFKRDITMTTAETTKECNKLRWNYKLQALLPRAWKPKNNLSFLRERRVCLLCLGGFLWSWPWCLWPLRSRWWFTWWFILIRWSVDEGGHKMMHRGWWPDRDPCWVFWWFWRRWRFWGHHSFTPGSAWGLVQIEEIFEDREIMYSFSGLPFGSTTIVRRTEGWYICFKWRIILRWRVGWDINDFGWWFHSDLIGFGWLEVLIWLIGVLIAIRVWLWWIREKNLVRFYRDYGVSSHLLPRIFDFLTKFV